MGRKCNRKNDEYAMMERRRQVANLYLQGKTQWAIARAVKVSQGTVSNDLAAVREDWLASALRDFDAMKAEELARLDRLEAVAWEGWERSCRDAVSTHQRTVQEREVRRKAAGKNGTAGRSRMAPVRKVEQRTAKGQAGDPRFLERVAWCVETRLKLMGLLRPGSQVNVNAPPSSQEFWDALAGVTAQGEIPDEIEERIRRAELEHRQAVAAPAVEQPDGDGDE